MGVKNLVVVPKAMGQGGKKQKTDRRDSAELCDPLDRYLRGQRKALSVVGVPSVEQDEKRALIRYHRQIMADRGRCRGSRQRLAVRARHRSPWPMVATQELARTQERSSAQRIG
jgi:hypothetical protein